MPAPDAILFDGECALCDAGAQWVRRRDRLRRFEFLPYQSPDAARRFPGLDPRALAAEMHVVTSDGRVLRGVDAAARVFRGLPGWAWLGRLLGSRALGWAARPAYAWVAQRRRELPGGAAGCRIGGR